MPNTSRRFLLLALCGVALGGCSEDKGTPVPNIDPETFIAAAEPLEGGNTEHHVDLFWNGGDIDGTVVEWQYILDTYPRSVTDYANINPVMPALEDPRWTSNGRSANLQLVVSADTLRADPRGDIGDGRFERWHTFWVRALDNEEGIDATPAFRTFQAFTKAPEMRLVWPVVVGQVPVLPVSFVLNWDGADDIGVTGNYQMPAASRWVLRPVQLDGNNMPIGYPDALYDLDESEWSDWVSWNEPDSTGKEAAFLDRLPPGTLDTPFLFAVQGRDDGGAVTPQFSLDEPFENNVGVFMLSHSIPTGPSLTVHATLDTLDLGPWDFIGSSATTQTVMVPAGAVSVRWDVMEASHYGARPGDYRYGWNITDPGNDTNWSAWGGVRMAPQRNLIEPVEELQIQARDHIGQVTTAILRFQRM